MSMCYGIAGVTASLNEAREIAEESLLVVEFNRSPPGLFAEATARIRLCRMTALGQNSPYTKGDIQFRS